MKKESKPHRNKQISKKNTTTYNNPLSAWLKSNFVSIIYIVIPPIITVLIFKLKPAFVSFLSKTKLGESSIYNGVDLVKSVVEPFTSCALLLLSIGITYLLLSVIARYLEKKSFVLKNEKTWLFLIEIILVIVSAVIVIYNHAIGFEYRNYGLNVQALAESIHTERSLYQAIEPIPNISYHSIITSDSSFIYAILLRLSLFAKRCLENLDLYLSFFGAIIIPLRIKSYKKENAKP